jgi:hypothetical protein
VKKELRRSRDQKICSAMHTSETTFPYSFFALFTLFTEPHEGQTEEEEKSPMFHDSIISSCHSRESDRVRMRGLIPCPIHARRPHERNTANHLLNKVSSKTSHGVERQIGSH